ncbi:MAG: 50S ribosomal protein L29 [Chloroflexota bacterium]|nr:50S ribosomal protein L29 [Chloroflexota bacterium]
MEATDIRGTDDATIRQQMTDAKQEMFNLRMRMAVGHTVNTARIRNLRRDVARMQTILNERRRDQGA